jgi:hypothetical protein
LVVPEFFNTIEQTALSTWIRETESIFGFYFILLLHNFALATLVGPSTMIDLRLLGVAPTIPIRSLKPLYTAMACGIALAVVTGALLLYAYPTKALTNPLFYVKLLVIAIGVAVVYKLKARVFDNESMSESDMVAAGRGLAKLSLVLWIGAITAGRLLAYTYKYLYYGFRGEGFLILPVHFHFFHF